MIYSEQDHHDAHADFIRNDTGDSVERIMALLLHVPLLTFLIAFATSRIGCSSLLWAPFIVEFALFTCPMTLVMTSLTEHVTKSSLLLLSLALSIWLVMTRPKPSSEEKGITERNPTAASLNPSSSDQQRMFVSWFKGAVVVITSIAILAVDFQVFPRTSAKTVRFGTSLMDLGASLFVISTALTSPWSRGGGDHGGDRNSHIAKVHIFKQAWVIPILGVSRLIAIKLLNYPEVVDEYGVHWNFFMTLSGIWLMRDITHTFFSLSPSQLSIVACCIVVGYQWALLNMDLTSFIFEAERGDSFLTANREGVISMAVGYFPILLLVEAFSRKFIFGIRERQTHEQGQRGNGVSTHAEPRDKQVVTLVCVTLILWTLWYFCHNFIQHTSRRLMNASFVVFSLATALSILASLLLVECLIRAHLGGGDDATGIARVCRSLQLANKYSLELFLFANVCTGLVNMLWDTHNMDNSAAYTLLVGYSLLLQIFPTLGAQLKFG